MTVHAIHIVVYCGVGGVGVIRAVCFWLHDIDIDATIGLSKGRCAAGVSKTCMFEHKASKWSKATGGVHDQQ